MYQICPLKCSHFRETIEYLIKDSKLWDITTFHLVKDGRPLVLKTLPNNQDLVVYLEKVYGTVAYVINRHAAKKLLEKSLPIKMPVDNYFTMSWELDLKFTGIENSRIAIQFMGDSDIGTENSRYIKGKSSIFDRIKRRLYKKQSYIIRYLYNLKIYLKNKWSIFMTM